MKYACGNEVIEGDTVERINDSLSLAVGEIYTVYVPSLAYGYIGIKEIIGPITYDPSYFKLIKRKEKEMLQRDQEYDVRLTGEDIAHIYLLTGYAYNMHSLYNKAATLLGASRGVIGVKLPSVNLFAQVDYKDAMSKLLATPETEDQRKLRELKEQYAELGKAIEAMEKK